MKTIKVDEVQENFLIGVLEKAGHDIWDDLSVHGFEEEDWENNREGVEEEIGRFKNHVVDKVLKQLKS